MMVDQKPYTFDRVFRMGIGVAVLWALVWLLRYLSDVLIPFAVAVVLAYLMNPLVNRVQRRIHRRGVAVLLTLVTLVLVVATVVSLLAPVVVHQVVDMGHLVSALVTNSELAEKLSERLPPNIWEQIKDYASRDDVQQFFRTGNFVNAVTAGLKRVLPGVWGVITGTTSMLVGFVGLAVVALYVIFLLVDYGLVEERWKALLPQPYRGTVVEFVDSFEGAMHRYFRGQAMIAFFVGVMYAGGFLIIGLPMGLLLGLFIGLLNMVPFLQIVGVVPAYLFAIVNALNMGRNIWIDVGLVTIVVVVSEVVQSAVLVPKIQGKVTGLHPVVILLSLSVWGKLLGFLGLIIALPMTCIVLAYYERFLASLARSQSS
jgi:predicted PurR-regulated permease PerM